MEEERRAAPWALQGCYDAYWEVVGGVVLLGTQGRGEKEGGRGRRIQF